MSLNKTNKGHALQLLGLSLILILLSLPAISLTGCSDTPAGPVLHPVDSGVDQGDVSPNGAPDSTGEEQDTSVEAGPDGGAAGQDDPQPPHRKPPPPPQITSVIPDRGPVTGGTHISIMGEGFNRTATLMFGQAPVEDAIVVSPEELRFSAPPVDEPGTVDLQVETDGGLVRMVDGFTYEPIVELNQVEPAAVSTDGGEVITVRGSEFAPGALVLIDDRELIAPRVLDENTITGIAPANGKPGLKNISLHQPGSTVVLQDAILYYQQGRLDQVYPDTGPLGGGVIVTILGRGFTGSSRFLFGENQGEVIATGEDGTVATVKVPGAPTPGTVELQLINGGGTHHRLPEAFTYWDCPDTPHMGEGEGEGAGDGGSGGSGGGTNGGEHWGTGTGPGSPPIRVQGVVPGSGSVAGGERVRIVGCGFTPNQTTFLLGTTEAEQCQVSPQGNLAHCTTPPAPDQTKGPVDVTGVDPMGGKATLTGGFTYHTPLTLERISPDRGPVEGGVTVLLSGQGFADVTSCRVSVGAVSADGDTIQALSDNTLRFTLPPGASGPADVKVTCLSTTTQTEQTQVMEMGFFYEAPLRLVAIRPTSGSIGGNTYVELAGTGFHRGVEVFFDGAAATEVKILSGNRLSARTPVNRVGSVDLIIGTPSSPSSPDSSPLELNPDLRLARGFRYYDPANVNGGVWGGPIQDSVNVAVLNNSTGAPIMGALVIMGEDPDNAPYQGTTGPNGRITFSDPGLEGPRTIHGLKEHYAGATIAGFNGANVTLLLAPYPKPPEPNEDNNTDGTLHPDPTTATIKGRLTGMGKNFPIPRDQNQVRVVRLTTSSYRYFAHTSLPDPGPGATLYQDGDYVLRSRTGMLAVVAIGGLEDVITGEFTPVVMGVRRRLFLTPDQVAENVDVDLDVPMDVVARFAIDSPPYAPEGPNALKLESHLLFDGDDGAWDLFTYAGYQGRILNQVEIPHFPRLEGPLQDSTIMLRAGVYKEYAGGGLGQPYSVTTLYHINDVTKEIKVTPWCGVPFMVDPITNGTVTGNTLTWTIIDGSHPPDGQVIWMMGMGAVTATVWNIHAAGHVRQFKLPSLIWEMDGFPTDARTAMGMEPIIDSRLNINNFVNSDFYGATKQSYGMNVEYFYF